MLLSQVIRGAAITGRTDVVRTRLLGRQGGRWTQQWIDSAFPEAAARSYGTPPPADPEASARILADLRRDGLLTEDEFERLAATRGG